MARIFDRYRTVIAYLFFGGLTTMINIAVYLGLARWLGVSYLVSNVSAWIVSVLFAYAANRIWVFGSQGRGLSHIWREGSAFIGSRLLSGAVDTALMYLMIELLGLDDLAVKLFANGVVIVMNYVIAKEWVFKDRERGVVMP